MLARPLLRHVEGSQLGWQDVAPAVSNRAALSLLLILASAARVVVEDLACRESGGSLVCTLGGRGVVVPRMMILLGDVGLLPG